MFQSLFYWKYHFNFQSLFWGFKMYVSILVLLEVPLQRRESQSCSKQKMQFQSLFYWKYHFNKIHKDYKTIINGVSILVLLEVPLQHIGTYDYQKIDMLFQSLFYWKYHFNFISCIQICIGKSGFNNIFIGLEVPLQRNSWFNWVSILVLLEVPLQLS